MSLPHILRVGRQTILQSSAQISLSQPPICGPEVSKTRFSKKLLQIKLCYVVVNRFLLLRMTALLNSNQVCICK